MYERSYGYKYDEAGKGWQSAADIAKLIRADIKQAVAEGLLPAHPTYSVRSESYSGGQAIDVEVKGWPAAWQDCDGTVPGTRSFDGLTAQACPNAWCKGRNDPTYAHAAEVHQVLTEEAQAAKTTLERIHGAYNHDGSDVMTDYFDVRYYGGVRFQDARSAAFEAEEKTRKELQRVTLNDAAEKGTKRIVNYKRDGTRAVHDCVEIAGKLLPVCGARFWRGALLGNGAGQELTCTRCKNR